MAGPLSTACIILLLLCFALIAKLTFTLLASNQERAWMRAEMDSARYNYWKDLTNHEQEIELQRAYISSLREQLEELQRSHQTQ
jgi:hypothetical protein